MQGPGAGDSSSSEKLKAVMQVSSFHAEQLNSVNCIGAGSDRLARGGQ